MNHDNIYIMIHSYATVGRIPLDILMSTRRSVHVRTDGYTEIRMDDHINEQTDSHIISLALIQSLLQEHRYRNRNGGDLQ